MTRRHPLREKLLKLLVHRHLPFIGMLSGVLVGLPVLWTGWGPSDDVLQRSIILTQPLSVILTRLFVFLDPTVNASQMDLGSFPWWTYEPARVIFFRPIAALSLWLDYQLWPKSNLLMHLHSLLLYGVLCLTAAHLYRRLMGNTPQTGLAVMLFSLSTAHIGCVVSFAARNLLLTANFGFLALFFHDRWRREGWKPGLLLGLLCLILSLLSAETGVATCAFLLGYAVFLEARPWHQRLLSLLPYAAVAAAWLIGYQALGYGASGSGFYLSPLQEPVRFLVAVVERLPFLLMGQWILPDPVVYTVLSEGARSSLWVLSVLVLAFIGWVLFPLVKRERTARTWTAAMLLSVLPVCAVSPASGRHLTFISLAAFALLAQLAGGLLLPSEWAPLSRTWRRAASILSLMLCSLHLIFYPIAGTIVRMSLDTYAVAVLDIGSPPCLEEQDAVIVNAPSPSLFLYFPSYRSLTGQPLPERLRVLAPGFSAVNVFREDDHTLVLEPDSGFLVPPVSLKLSGEAFLPLFHSSYSFQYGDGLFRSAAHPFLAGERVQLTGVTYTVLSLTEDDRPQVVRVIFDRSLEDASLRWYWWDWSRSSYQPFILPAVGESVTVPGPY